MFGPVADGKIEWKRLETIDYDLMGYLLSCHLIIEHYMDEYLKAEFPSLDWNVAKLTFGQRISLLRTQNVGGKFDSTPAINHINSLVTDSVTASTTRWWRRTCFRSSIT